LQMQSTKHKAHTIYTSTNPYDIIHFYPLIES
jgi:hypothetical protein